MVANPRLKFSHYGKREPRHASFSEDRINVALSALNDPDFRSADLPHNARVIYAMGFLIADNSGMFTKDELLKACADPSVDQCARNLVRQAGY